MKKVPTIAQWTPSHADRDAFNCSYLIIDIKRNKR